MRFIFKNKLKHFEAGDVLSLPTDAKGNPIDPFWKNRLKDGTIEKEVKEVKKERVKKEEKPDKKPKGKRKLNITSKEG